jgi:hypothetical protein
MRLANEAPILAVLFFVLVRAPIIMEAEAALFDVALGSDAVSKQPPWKLPDCRNNHQVVADSSWSPSPQEKAA